MNEFIKADYLAESFERAKQSQNDMTCAKCLRLLDGCSCRETTKLEWDMAGRMVWHQPYDMGSGV
jgi:hypothetical protein